jgi:hypothetical protein
VLVEECGHVMATMAAYIDLNPVRAGLVADPKKYRFSGYYSITYENSHYLACELYNGFIRKKISYSMMLRSWQIS